MTTPLPTAPAGVAASALDWMAATGHGRLHLYEQPVMVERSEPDGARLGKEQRLQHYHRYCAPAAVVAELPDASVIGACGAVVTSDGCVVADQIASFDRAMAGHRVWQRHGGSEVRLAGTAAVVAGAGSGDRFRQFLTDTLPRIQLVRDAGLEPDHWIVAGGAEPWQRQGLQAASIDPDTVHTARWERPLRVERLIVPSRTGFTQATAPWARVRLRRLLEAPSRLGPDRLLLASSASEAYRLRNESGLAALLADFGFTPVVLEHLRFEEQAALIGRARCIVATHSAALSHLLHAPAGGTLIEIAPSAVLKPDYAVIADLAGWRHRFLPADTVDVPGGDETIEYLDVDPAAVVASLAGFLPGLRGRSKPAPEGALGPAPHPAQTSAIAASAATESRGTICATAPSMRP